MLKNRYFLTFIPAHMLACLAALVAPLALGRPAMGYFLIPLLLYFLLGLLMSRRHPGLGEESRRSWLQGTGLNAALLLLLYYGSWAVSGLASSWPNSVFAYPSHYLSPWADGLVGSALVNYNALSALPLVLLSAVSCALVFALGARWNYLLAAKNS